MFKVVKSINVGNNCIDKVKGLEGLDGWSVGKPHKQSIMCVVVTCKYEVKFKDKEDFEKNFESMEQKYKTDLLNVGFTKEYIDKNTKTVLPTISISQVDEEPMTWKKWHEQRIKK